jgi:nucleoside-diphosphate-sugar epimerase
MKKVLVLGGGGFIGNHLVKRLKQQGHWVRAVDLKYPEFSATTADEFVIGDLRLEEIVKKVITEDIEEIYQLAADMGGAGFVFTGDNDLDIMLNSAAININVIKYALQLKNLKRIFYSSSACIYPERNQKDPDNPICTEETAYPAEPDSEYGWEKLFSERLYLAAHRNYGLPVRIARFHNVFGEEGTFQGGREKAPAAICRKVALAKVSFQIWGSGKQTRSFLHVSDCLDAVELFVKHENFTGPINIGSEEMISIRGLAEMAIEISGKKLLIENIAGPIGVNGRCSDNTLIEKVLNWKPKLSLRQGMERTYFWIAKQFDANN